MNTTILEKTAAKIARDGMGILAADESTTTATKRFDTVGIESTEETRRKYRNILFTTPDIQNYISGIILFEETLYQKTDDEIPFPEYLRERGIEPGIKVDQGLVSINTIEQNTLGLDSLKRRLETYIQNGATFAKWRAVYTISETTPSEETIQKNAIDLSNYAKICQEVDVVPIIEPEVLMDGDHTFEKSYEVTKRVLTAVFDELSKNEIYLPGALLKPSMVISGSNAPVKSSPEEIAKMTLDLLKNIVPKDVGGVFFLSGGQSPQEATFNLQRMHELDSNLPWHLSFSYGRALQEPVLKAWANDRSDIAGAQKEFLKRCKLNSLATLGKYFQDMEHN